MNLINFPKGEPPVKILIVDDHPNTAMMMARAVTQLGPAVQVISATSGSEALKRIEGGAADILITDMIMPEMTGLELIEKLQNHPSGRPTFSFLMTAYDVPGLKVTARRLKVKEVIIKPVHPERICQLISKAVEELKQNKPASKELTSRKSINILIADDQPDNLSLLARYLDNEGYGYIKAKDGIETLEKVRGELPDLVLLDVNMPHKDGFVVLKEIRSDPITQHIPVIILTAARLDAADVQSGLNMGADDYVTKPFDRRELMARIRTKLRVKAAEDVIRRRNRELHLLPELGKELSVHLNLDELSDLVLKRTVETLGAEVGHLILLNAKSPLHKEYGVSDSETQNAPVQLPPLNHLLVKMEETRESILIENTHTDPSWQSSNAEAPRSAIVVPMFGRAALIGLLVLVHEQPGYFTVEHQSLLQAIVGQASVAVENARLYADMAQEKQTLDAVLHGAADAIIMFDEDGGLSMLNPAAAKLFTDYETKLGMPLARGKGYDMLLDALEQSYTLGTPHSRELKWADARTFTALFTPITNGGCVVVLHDVSHFKQLEKVKDEFIATASHDLRNPLTSIRGYNQLIQHMGPLNDNQKDFTNRIQNAVSHMTELVENMLDIAKMDLGEAAKRDTIDASQVIWELADEFQPQAEAKRQLLVLGETATNSKVEGDALKIRQALRNLIGNAIKYTPDGGVVTLSLEHAAGMALIKIKDTGYGIPTADLPHLFNRFYRVRNNGHDDIEGNGLGLAIVKSIAEQHGGDVTIESEVGKGSCFSFTVPLKSNI